MSEKQFDYMISMAVSKSTLEPEYEYTAAIKASGIRIPVLAVQALTLRHDYVNNIFEDNAITVAVTPSAYDEIMARVTDRLTLVLTKVPFIGVVTSTCEYIAILNIKTNTRVEGNVDESSSTTGRDDGNIRLVTLQLMDKASYDVRLRKVGGIFKNDTGHNVLKFILASIDLSGTYNQENIVGSINSTGLPYSKVHKELNINEGTEMLALPDYIQEVYGVYSSGLGVFFKKQNWYIYPLWAVDRQSGNERSLVIINAAANKYAGLDRNHFMRGKTLTVIATGETGYASDTDKNNLNLGTAVRFSNVGSLMSDVSSTDPSADPVMNASKYVTEYGHTDYKGSLQNVVTDPKKWLSNEAAPASELARRGGSIVTVTWHNGNIDLLLPGMPVVFYYRLSTSVGEFRGTLISSLQHTYIDGSLADKKHIGYVVMRLFLKEEI